MYLNASAVLLLVTLDINETNLYLIVYIYTAVEVYTYVNYTTMF